MAIFHLTTKMHSRADDPKLNALRSYAYRAGVKVINPKTGKIYNHTNKEEVISTKTMVPKFCPTWMSDPIQLWRKVEEIETRCDAQIFRELEFALVHELTLEHSTEIIEQFINEQFICKGMCATYAIHKKDGNWHCHVMLTTRNIDYDEDNNAYFGKKNRDWNSISLVPKWRKAWADLNNSSLSDNGFSVQISEKSNAERGLDAIPTEHIGPEFTSRKNESIARKRQRKIKSNKKVKELNAKRENITEIIKAEDAAIHADLVTDELLYELNGLSEFASNDQIDIQARYSFNAALSYFQLSDYENRKNYLIAMGKSYTLTDFQSDINRLNNSDDGWMKTWWQEKIDVNFGANAEMLMKHVPAWFYVDSPKETKYYPLSIKLPKPSNELLESYFVNLKTTPENCYNLSANGLTMRVNDYTQIEQFGIDRSLRVGEITALKIDYWNQAGFADWRRDVLRHLTTFNVPATEVNYKLLKESFGKRDSVDAAEDLAKHLGYLQPDSAYENDQSEGLVSVSDIRKNTVRSLINRGQVWPKSAPWYTEPDAPYPRSIVQPNSDE